MLAPLFDEQFRSRLDELLQWRRDVRSFTSRSIEPDLWDRLVKSLETAPSVGLSQPWRLVRVRGEAARRAVRENFAAANADALAAQPDGERAALYARLKLEGLSSAPEQVAVMCDPDPEQGHGLGRGTIAETVHASAVCAVMQLWIVARAHGVGLGWVSILDPVRLKKDLELHDGWDLVAYLCLGYPDAERETPELETHGWEHRRPQAPLVIER